MTWDDATTRARDMSHCFGFGRWADGAAWARLGTEQVELARMHARTWPPALAVDYGCGGGSATLALRHAGSRVIAVDPSELNRAECRAQCGSDGVTVVAPDEAEASADLLLCCNVLQHLTEWDVGVVLDRCRALARTGGDALIQTRYRAGIEGAFDGRFVCDQPYARAMLELSGWTIIAVTRRGDHDYWHCRAAGALGEE